MHKGLPMNQHLITYAPICVMLPSSGIKDNFEATLSSTEIRTEMRTVQKISGKKPNISFICLQCT